VKFNKLAKDIFLNPELTFINVMTRMIVTAQEESRLAFAHFSSRKIQADVAAISIIFHAFVDVNA
jgi:hypothetical protein